MCACPMSKLFTHVLIWMSQPMSPTFIYSRLSSTLPSVRTNVDIISVHFLFQTLMNVTDTWTIAILTQNVKTRAPDSNANAKKATLETVSSASLVSFVICYSTHSRNFIWITPNIKTIVNHRMVGNNRARKAHRTSYIKCVMQWYNPLGTQKIITTLIITVCNLWVFVPLSEVIFF